MKLNPFAYAKRFTKPYSKALSVKYRGFRARTDARAPGWVKRAWTISTSISWTTTSSAQSTSTATGSHPAYVPLSAAGSPPDRLLRAQGHQDHHQSARRARLRQLPPEVEACRRHGIKLVNFQLRSRMAPPVEAIHEARKLFNELEYPILFHCKSGADRAGLMGALFMYMKEGKPIEEAVKQLSLKFGHFKKSETGVLDYLFERYMSDNDAEPMTFFEWLETRYDPAEIKRTFRSQGWANVIVNRALQRE